MSVIELERAFEKLSPAEREEFAEWYEGKLAQGGFDQGNEEAWAVEVERRVRDIEEGKVQCIPADQVFAEIRKHFGIRA